MLFTDGDGRQTRRYAWAEISGIQEEVAKSLGRGGGQISIGRVVNPRLSFLTICGITCDSSFEKILAHADGIEAVEIRRAYPR